MKRMAALLIFALFAPLLHAQSPSREQLMGIWIGVHAERDVDYFCPLPTYIQLNADSTYRLGLVHDTSTALTSSWAVTGNRVRLDTVQYAPGRLTIQNDLLRIETNTPLVFRRLTCFPIDSALAYQRLAGHSWQSNNLTVSLYANGQVSVENTATKTKTAHFWHLVQFCSSTFLVIRGNQYNENGGFKPLWQITKLSSNQMQAIGWNGCAVTTETFRLARDIPPGEVCRPTEFQPCDNCFSQAWYARSISSPSKRYDLTQLVTKYYQPVYQPGQSGLVKVQFVVNCEGEQGQLAIRGFGEDYCPKLFDSRITNQLRAICQNHIGTDPTFRQPKPTDPSHDVSIVITFRLTDGRITDILP
ncbi:hypothetical protein GCM10028816_31530 [Spirosoma lituiforme]